MRAINEEVMAIMIILVLLTITVLFLTVTPIYSNAQIEKAIYIVKKDIHLLQ